MFRLLNSHLQAYSLQVKLQDAVHTLGSQCVHSILCVIKTAVLTYTIYIVIRVQAHRDASIQVQKVYGTAIRGRSSTREFLAGMGKNMPANQPPPPSQQYTTY